MDLELLKHKTKIENYVKERELLFSVVDDVPPIERETVFKRTQDITNYIGYHKGQIERIIKEREKEWNL